MPLPRDTTRAMTESEFQDFEKDMFDILDEVVPAVQAVAAENKIDISSFSLGNFIHIHYRPGQSNRDETT